MTDEKCPRKTSGAKWSTENGHRRMGDGMADRQRPSGSGQRNGQMKMGDRERPTEGGQKKMGENKKADANKLGEDRGKWQGT